MWDSLHTHTHHTINQIEVSQYGIKVGPVTPCGLGDYVTTQEKVLATSALYLKRTSHN